ncbi:hypothetical protein J2X63_001190 [Agromyces sp. 3263]|uniref:hypothetical protein n=1 Tax=Agromyces sp. 3263 TaxID=2817750 RepID=UPI00285841E1|nr:hypothetical protein [Agromyces sp. 3263]MDR6905504.1 hypothetical protein [Agromyces sp. 3263]
MSEGSATGIDPRFDPRFQRGYTHDPSAVPAASLLPSASPADTSSSPAPADPSLDGRPSSEPPAHGPDAAVLAEAGPVDVDDPLVDQSLSPTRWLWIALAACAAFVVVGCVAFWVQASDPSNYIGGVRAGLDESVRLVINAMAPALVEAGLVGIVAVLVTWAVTGRRAASTEEQR